MWSKQHQEHGNSWVSFATDGRVVDADQMLGVASRTLREIPGEKGISAMKRVLVIDDDSGVRESFRAALEDAGYEVTTADNGRDGIESAQADRPDLVFLDLKMPGMSGVETLKELNEACPRVPVYVVTGFYGEFLAPLRELQSRGVDFNLARKPLSVTEIKAIAAGRIGAVSAMAMGGGDTWATAQLVQS